MKLKYIMTKELLRFEENEATEEQKKKLLKFIHSIFDTNIYPISFSYNPEKGGTIQLVNRSQRVGFPVDDIYSFEVRNKNFLSIKDVNGNQLLGLSKVEWAEITKKYYRQEDNYDNRSGSMSMSIKFFEDLLEELDDIGSTSTHSVKDRIKALLACILLSSK